MNSDQNSIKNQGGGEPKPYKPEEGSTGNINPQNDLGNQGQQSSNMPPQPESPNTDGGSGEMDQGGNMNQPGGGDNMPGQSDDSGQGPANIPSPPGLDSDDDFQKNFSQNNPGGNETPAPGPMPGDDNMDQPSQDGPGSVPPQDFDEADLSGNEYPPKKSNKKLFVILLIIILALGAAVAVYFLFLSPSSQEPVVNGDNEQEEVMQEEENNVNEEESDVMEEGTNEVPTVPVVEENEEGSIEEEATTTEESDVMEEEPSESQQSSNIPADSHESLFSTPADTTESITIESLTMENLQSELSESPTEVPLFKEVVFQDSDNNLITFGDVAGLLAPSVFNENLLSSFKQDATFYTYTDENGTWFGVVASLSDGADSTSVQNQVSSIENNTSEVSNFFLTDVGEASSWNDGGAGGVTSRYITFGSGNASFNYGWDGNNLVIGTSYPAFQEVVEHL